jgi:hypothetical protein
MEAKEIKEPLLKSKGEEGFRAETPGQVLEREANSRGHTLTSLPFHEEFQENLFLP